MSQQNINNFIENLYTFELRDNCQIFFYPHLSRSQRASSREWQKNIQLETVSFHAVDDKLRESFPFGMQ